MADAAALEERVVEVNDPRYSDDINHRLTAAVREVVGTDRVLVPADRPRVSQGERPRASFTERVTSTKAMLVGSLAVMVCVGLIIVTTGNHWYLLIIAFVVLAVALTTVTLTIIGLASTSEYPDPNLVALLSEHGIYDPEVRFSELVAEFTPLPTGEDRSTAVEEDPARALAEQREAVTPSGGGSEAVGPGSSGR